MSAKKKTFDDEREKRMKSSSKQKNLLDKHKKIIYNIASFKSFNDGDDVDEDDLDYVYASSTKIKRR